MNYIAQVERYLINSDIDMKSRKREHLFRRFYLIKFLRDKTESTSTRIGKVFNKDHATVLHALREVQNLEGLPMYEEVVEDLREAFPMSLPVYTGNNQSSITVNMPYCLVNLQDQLNRTIQHG